MKHNAKRSISILLAVLMCIGMLTGIVLLWLGHDYVKKRSVQ